MATSTSTYLPAELLQVFPDAVTQGFWEACARRELALQQCPRCGEFRHPPRPACGKCQSLDFVWTPISGRGTIYTYTVVHHPVLPGTAELVPYNIVVLEFPDAPGTNCRLISNVVDVAPEELRVGMEVEVVWEEPRPGMVIPRFMRAR